MALEFVREILIEENGTHFIINKIKTVYLPGLALKDDGQVDLEAAESICVSGLDTYHYTKTIGRLEYAKPDKSDLKFK